MPSIDRTVTPHTSYEPAQKNKFRPTFGFGTLTRESSETDIQDSQATKTDTRGFTFTRQSIDTARSYASRRKNRSDRGSLANISFFQRDLQPTENTVSDTRQSVVDLTINTTANMTVDNTLSQPTSRRPPVRMDAQDGPWSVSVAETPHDVHSYSLYIKSESITFLNCFFFFQRFLVHCIRAPDFVHVLFLIGMVPDVCCDALYSTDP